jgi:hypothetical protein
VFAEARVPPDSREAFCLISRRTASGQRGKKQKPALFFTGWPAKMIGLELQYSLAVATGSSFLVFFLFFFLEFVAY